MWKHGAIALTLLIGGCAAGTINPNAGSTTIVVPGLGGDELNYRGVRTSLHDAGSQDCLQGFDWGLKWPLFFVTLWDGALHNSTETAFEQKLEQWRKDHPDGRITIIAHSAGAGVALGGLARLPDNFGEVGPVILLAPDLSPKYDLGPALRHASVIHVFTCDRDMLWLGLFTNIFGAYDGHHESAAGQSGFDIRALSYAESQKIVEHPYQPKWESLDNGGGHFDWMAHEFVKQILKPLIDAQPAGK